MRAVSFQDVSPYVPVPYRKNKHILGVYLFLQKYRIKEWENTVREYFRDEMKSELIGKGSIDAACVEIQKDWSRFKEWIKKHEED